MQITTKDADIRVDDSVMRMYVAAPRPAGKYRTSSSPSFRNLPVDGVHPPLRRAYLAGHGFVVAAPEIYHRIERPGVVMPYDDIGRMWGNEGAHKTTVAEFDADARGTLDYLAGHPQVAPGKLGVMGFCIGGHLAWRGALDPRVKAAVCCYPTGVHNGKLGKDADAGTLARFKEIKAEMLSSSSATTIPTSPPKAARL